MFLAASKCKLSTLCLQKAMLAVERNRHVTQSTEDSPAESEHASSSAKSLDRTELDDLLDELLGQAATSTAHTGTRSAEHSSRTSPRYRLLTF